MWRHFSIKNAPPSFPRLETSNNGFLSTSRSANRISVVKLSIKKFFTNSAIGHEAFLEESAALSRGVSKRATNLGLN